MFLFYEGPEPVSYTNDYRLVSLNYIDQLRHQLRIASVAPFSTCICPVVKASVHLAMYLNTWIMFEVNQNFLIQIVRMVGGNISDIVGDMASTI